MNADNKFDYSKYSATELYDAYRQIDREKYADNFAEIIKEIHKRFNIPDDKIITDEYMVEVYFNYCSSKIKDESNGGESLEYDNSATLSERLGAAIIDGLIMLAPMLVIMFSFGIKSSYNYIKESGISAQITLAFFGQLLYLLINSTLLYKYGQSVGKKIIGIKIITLEGKLPTFFNIYVMRHLSLTIISLIPIIGRLFWIADDLFIFRENKRCIHDYFANTRVVKA